MEKLLLTVEESAKALGISRWKMSEMLLAGTIPSLKIGALRRVPVDALKEYVSSSVDVA